MTAVYVCDAIMGTGKTMSTITYLNEHPDGRYIYITPYLAEAERIKQGCPRLNFVEPSNKREDTKYNKTNDTAKLIKQGKNIATTHQAFKRYHPDMLDDIRAHGYVLIIDENIDFLETFDLHPNDLQMAIDSGWITDDNGIYRIAREGYSGRAFSELFDMLRSRELVRVDDEQQTLYYWALPPDLIRAFKDVFILTYLFDGQSIHHFLQIYNITYKRIGIERTIGGGYHFGDYPGYVPEYVSHIRDKIHILNNPKLNAIGDDYHALSMSWFDRDSKGVEQLKNNVFNCYRNLWESIPANRRLWGGFNKAYTKIRGNGYSKAFLTFNAKSTNAYRDRDCLVYIANIFMNVSEKTFYHIHGIEVDEDKYALSIMVQWIWRSAIRDGNEVRLYIPSSRMRNLLINWMNKLAQGANNDK